MSLQESIEKLAQANETLEDKVYEKDATIDQLEHDLEDKEEEISEIRERLREAEVNAAEQEAAQ